MLSLDGHAESPQVQPPKPPRIAVAYGLLIVLLGLGMLLLMAGTFGRMVRQGGTGLYVLPAGVTALAPALLLAYLGIRIMRGERLAVLAITVVLLVGAIVVMALDTRRGWYLVTLTVVSLAPLCAAAIRESGGFH